MNAPAHRSGRHHRAHVEVTCLSRNLWCVVTAELAAFAEAHEIPVESITVDSYTVLRFVRMEELEDMAIAVESPKLRALCERIHRAACAVRLDHPWWRAYLHELGVSPDEIARGLTVTTDNRADLFFERRKRLQPTPGPTLRGLL